MAKDRTDVPLDISSEVLFASDRTCCKCQDKGRAVQIHHIDENPVNHSIENLAVLCFQCHNDTMIKGGFGRKLSPNEVRKYRDDWVVRVKGRRDRADEIAAQAMASSVVEAYADRQESSEVAEHSKPLLTFVNKLPEIKEKIHKQAQKGWDIGITSDMLQASYDYIESLTAVLTKLASYYPEGHFDDEGPRAYFSSVIASRFQWHWSVLEIKGGTIVNVLVCGEVMADVERMVVDLVEALSEGYSDFDFVKWKTLWTSQH